MRNYRVSFYVDNVRCELVVGAYTQYDARKIIEYMFYGRNVNIISVS